MNRFNDWHLECWYKIKPVALCVFNDSDYESHWIKNAWLFLLDGADEKLREELIPEHSVVNIRIRLWLLGLYELLWNFKKAIDYNAYDYDPDSWAGNLGIKPDEMPGSISRQDHDEESCDEKLPSWITDMQKTFTSIIRTKLESTQEILNLMCNEQTLLSAEDFFIQYCDQNEYLIKNIDDFQNIEDLYEDYCFERKLQLSEEWKIHAGYEWVERIF